jgi:polysaccharide biosynthesis/export protein
MSCRDGPVSLSCAVRHENERRSRKDMAREQMKRRFTFFRFTAIGVLILQSCSAVLAQSEKNDLGGDKSAFRAGLTGAGAGSSKTAEKTGIADGQGNLLLGGQRHPLYRLQPSDVVEIDFVVAPEFNQTLTIQPDGYVMLKDAGMVEAQGLNMAEFSAAVQKAYRGYLHDPQAAVTLKDFERPYFIVGGEVGKPGKYELRSDITVAEAVQIAGGLTQQSKHSQVVLFRRVNDDLMETRLLNLKKMLKERSLKEDAHLRPGDLIFVPQNSISKIARFVSKPSASMYLNSTQF